MVGALTPQVAEDINYILHDHLHHLERIPMTRVRDLMIARLATLRGMHFYEVKYQVLPEEPCPPPLMEGEPPPPCPAYADAIRVLERMGELHLNPDIPDPNDPDEVILGRSDFGQGLEGAENFEGEQAYLHTLLRNSPIDWGMMVYSATRMTGVMDSVFNVPGWPRIQSAYSIMHTETE